MKKLFSFIIPAHNCEKTISDTIESIVMQTKEQKQDIEIIVVSNGCTDNTDKTIKALQNKYNFIQLQHSAQGVSSARNKGIDVSTGEWLVFVDADDTFLPNGISIMRNAIHCSKPYDIYFFGHTSGKNTKPVTSDQSTSYESSDQMADLRTMIIKNPTKYLQVWAKIFRKSVVGDLRFDERIAFSEDSDFVIRYILRCKTAILLRDVIYNYNIMNTSTMRCFDRKKLTGYINALTITYSTIKLQDRRLQIAFINYILIHLNIVMVRELYSNLNPDPFKKKFKAMKEIAQSGVFSYAIKNYKVKNNGLSLYLLPGLLLKYHMYFLASILFNVRVRQNAKKEVKK